MQKTPLEEAIDRAMKKNHPNKASVREDDAQQIAGVVLRHWGDEAPLVLARAVELARNEVGRYGVVTPPTAEAERIAMEGKR